MLRLGSGGHTGHAGGNRGRTCGSHAANISSRRSHRRRGGQIGRTITIQRVVRIQGGTHLHHLRPFLVQAAGHVVHFARHLAKGHRVLATRVDLQQLQADGLALGLTLQRLAQDLLGLGLATVGDVDLGLGDRVDLGRRALADRGDLRAGAGHRVDALATGGAEQRVGAEFVGADAVGEAVILAAAAAQHPEAQASGQGSHAQTRQQQGVLRQALDQAALLLAVVDRRGLGHVLGLVGIAVGHALDLGLGIGSSTLDGVLVRTLGRFGLILLGGSLISRGFLGSSLVCGGLVSGSLVGSRLLGSGLLCSGLLGSRFLGGSLLGSDLVGGGLGLGSQLVSRSLGLGRLLGHSLLGSRFLGSSLVSHLAGGVAGLVGSRRGSCSHRAADLGTGNAGLLQLSLQVSQRLVLQLQHALQGANVLLQLGDAAVGFLERGLAGHLGFGITGTDGAALLILATFRAAQLQAVLATGLTTALVIDLRADGTAGGAAAVARSHFRRGTGHALLVGAEVARRHAQLATGLGAVDRRDLALGRDGQRAALTDQVGVVLDERRRVGAVDGHDGLIQRGAGRTHAGSNHAQRLALTHRDGAAFAAGVTTTLGLCSRLLLGLGRLAGSLRTALCTALLVDQAAGGRIDGAHGVAAGRGRAGGSGCRGGASHRCIARTVGLVGILLGRRIQQEGVFTAERARRPAQLDHQIHERIVDGPAGSDLDEVAAAPVLDVHAHAGQRFLVLQTHTAESLGRGDPCLERFGLVRTDGGDFHLGAQRLSQCGLDGQAAETGSLGGRDATPGQDRQGDGNRSRHLAAPGATRRHRMQFTAGLFRQGTTSYRNWNETNSLDDPAGICPPGNGPGKLQSTLKRSSRSQRALQHDPQHPAQRFGRSPQQLVADREGT